jgi:N-acetyl-D-muramate 6-phosphate phosphatase
VNGHPRVHATPRAVLFDLDGTLLDTAPDMVAALNQLLRESGREPLQFARARGFVSHGAKALVRLGFPEADAARFEELRMRYLQIYRTMLTVGTTIYEGVEAALADLEAGGIAWGIVTNKPGWLTRPLTEHFAWHRRAGVIVSGDTLNERKPHPAPLLHAARQLQASPADCVYIGDAERDVLAARAAGMKALVAMFGYIPADEHPLKWPACHWLESPQQMTDWLRSLAEHPR